MLSKFRTFGTLLAGRRKCNLIQVCESFAFFTRNLMITGTTDVDYKGIGRPNEEGCEPCESGVALEKLSFAGGQFFTVGGSVAKALEDTPAYLQGASTYTQEIRASRSIHVVLFDVGDHRGWLVDGPNALLHLACTHISLNPRMQNTQQRWLC